MSDGPDYLLGSLVAAALLAFLVLAAAFRRVGPDERLVVRRSGRVRAVAGPGLTMIFPLLDRLTRVPVGPIEADLGCRTGACGDPPGFVRGRVVFRVSDPRRYAADPDAAFERACRAAEEVLCEAVASCGPERRRPAVDGRTLASRVPETAGLTAVDLEAVDLEFPLDR